MDDKSKQVLLKSLTSKDHKKSQICLRKKKSKKLKVAEACVDGQNNMFYLCAATGPWAGLWAFKL